MVNQLVLLPGLDGTGELFDDFVAVLPRTIEVTVVRYPTHQVRSYSELLVFVRDSVAHLDRFVLLGESFSSPLAIKLAGALPANLAGLIICAGFASNPFPRSKLFIKRWAKPFLFRLPTPDFILRYFLVGFSAPPARIRRIRQNRLLVQPEVLANRVQEILNCDAREDLIRTRVPIMYMQGACDRLIGKECFREIQKLQPLTELVSLPAPHMVLKSKPNEAAEAVMKFVRELEAKPRPAPDPASLD